MSKSNRLVLTLLVIFAAGSGLRADDPVSYDWPTMRAKPASIQVINMTPGPLVSTAGKGNWSKVPANLTDMSIYVAAEGKGTDGVADITVTGDGYLLLACDYNAGGNDEGGWKEEVWDAQKLKNAGWAELSQAQLGGQLIRDGGAVCPVFAKQVHAGENYRLRCSKYDPPHPIIPGMVDPAAPQAAVTPIMEVTPADNWPAIISEPATVEVANMAPSLLVASNDKKGWVRVPTELTQANATVYTPGNGTTNPNAAVDNGLADITVTGDGYLLLACNFGYQGNRSGGWTETVWAEQDFKQHGWTELSKSQLGGLLIDPGNQAQVILVKQVHAGDHFKLRCNKYFPPYPILTGALKPAA